MRLAGRSCAVGRCAAMLVFSAAVFSVLGDHPAPQSVATEVKPVVSHEYCVEVVDVRVACGAVPHLFEAGVVLQDEVLHDPRRPKMAISGDGHVE